MSVLFHTLGVPSYRIFGDPEEPGAWECSCRHGGDHLRKGADGERGHPCKHLSRLWADAKERGELDLSYFRPTRAGEQKADNCRCNGESIPLDRVGQPPKVLPPGGPPPGMPSRNKPCPCGWVNPQLGRVDEYKRCHGRPGGPPEGAPEMPEITPGAPGKTPRQQAAERGRETRRAHGIERRERAELGAAVGEAGDERRRAVRALAEARRGGASPEQIAELEARAATARERERIAKERARAKR